MTRGLVTGLEHAAGALLAAVFVAGIAHVGVRLVAGGGLIWFGDVARYALAWIVMLGAAAAAFRGTHIAIETGLGTGESAAVRQAVLWTRLAASVLFLAVLFWTSAALLHRTSPQSFVTLRWLSLGWGYAALPAGAGLMLIAACAEGWRALGRTGTASDADRR